MYGTLPLLLGCVLFGAVALLALLLLQKRRAEVPAAAPNSMLINVRMCMDQFPTTDDHLRVLSARARDILAEQVTDEVGLRLVRLSSDGVPLQSIINIREPAEFSPTFDNSLFFCVDACFQISGVEPAWSVALLRLGEHASETSSISFRSTCNVFMSDPITYVLNVDFCDLTSTSAQQNFLRQFQSDLSTLAGAEASSVTISELQTTCQVEEDCDPVEASNASALLATASTDPVVCPCQITFRVPDDVLETLDDAIGARIDSFTDSSLSDSDSRSIVFSNETRQRFADDLPGLLGTLTSVVITEMIDCAAAAAWRPEIKYTTT